MPISLEKALSIAQAFSHEISDAFPGKILAVFAIGSLGGGYYRPGQSDIDTVVITSCSRDDRPAIARAVRRTANYYQENYNVPKGFGAIVFAEEQLYPPYRKEEELIQEILRLKAQGLLVFGAYDLSAIPSPQTQDIIDDARVFQAWADEQKRLDPDFGIHDTVSFVNSTLIALRRYLMIAHGIIDFNKFHIIDQYLTHQPPVVNPAIFDFIQRYLQNDAPTVTPEQFAEMVKWHDDLYQTINRLVL